MCYLALLPPKTPLVIDINQPLERRFRRGIEKECIIMKIGGESDGKSGYFLVPYKRSHRIPIDRLSKYRHHICSICPQGFGRGLC